MSRQWKSYVKTDNITIKRFENKNCNWNFSRRVFELEARVINRLFFQKSKRSRLASRIVSLSFRIIFAQSEVALLLESLANYFHSIWLHQHPALVLFQAPNDGRAENVVEKAVNDAKKQKFRKIASMTGSFSYFSSETKRHRFICRKCASTWICCSPYLVNVFSLTHSRSVFRLILMIPLRIETFENSMTPLKMSTRSENNFCTMFESSWDEDV